MSVSQHFKQANASNFLKEVDELGRSVLIRVNGVKTWIGYAGVRRYTMRRYRSPKIEHIDRARAVELVVAYLYPDPNSYAFMDTDPAYGHKEE